MGRDYTDDSRWRSQPLLRQISAVRNDCPSPKVPALVRLDEVVPPSSDGQTGLIEADEDKLRGSLFSYGENPAELAGIYRNAEPVTQTLVTSMAVVLSMLAVNAALVQECRVIGRSFSDLLVKEKTDLQSGFLSDGNGVKLRAPVKSVMGKLENLMAENGRAMLERAVIRDSLPVLKKSQERKLGRPLSTVESNKIDALGEAIFRKIENASALMDDTLAIFSVHAMANVWRVARCWIAKMSDRASDFQGRRDTVRLLPGSQLEDASANFDSTTLKAFQQPMQQKLPITPGPSTEMQKELSEEEKKRLMDDAILEIRTSGQYSRASSDLMPRLFVNAFSNYGLNIHSSDKPVQSFLPESPGKKVVAGSFDIYHSFKIDSEGRNRSHYEVYTPALLAKNPSLEVPRDGDCFFRAILTCVRSRYDRSAGRMPVMIGASKINECRKIVADYLDANRERFAHLIEIERSS